MVHDVVGCHGKNNDAFAAVFDDKFGDGIQIAFGVTFFVCDGNVFGSAGSSNGTSFGDNADDSFKFFSVCQGSGDGELVVLPGADGCDFGVVSGFEDEVGVELTGFIGFTGHDDDLVGIAGEDFAGVIDSVAGVTCFCDAGGKVEAAFVVFGGLVVMESDEQVSEGLVSTKIFLSGLGTIVVSIRGYASAGP